MLNLGTDETGGIVKDLKCQRISTTEDIPCRLCHSRLSLTQESPNIYEAALDFSKTDCENGVDEKILIADVCEIIVGIKYERHAFLPERICERCLEMLKDFYEQRRYMQQRERELQQDLKNVISLDARYRPGLNGNPGVFQFLAGEEGCVIVEVDPDQLCDTSEDEFMGSDCEAEPDDDEWDEEDEEEAPNEEDVDIPLGMDAAQMALMQAHQSAETNVNTTPHPKSTFLCQYCDLAFTLQTDCQQHELSAHEVSAPFSCNYCQLRLSTRPALIAHIKELHDAERPYVCAHCSKGFVRRSDLKKHTIVHTGVRPFSCHVCSKSFSRNTNLTKHLRIHSSVKPFVCQQCPRSFQTPLELMKHARTHSEIKPYQCDRCPASFVRKDKLSMHQQVHIKREQHHQQARNNGTEQIQMPLHPYLDAENAAQQMPNPHPYPTGTAVTTSTQTKVKPTMKLSRSFHCDVCDRGFQRERDLQRHRALHMDRLFSCKICGQGFNRREQLQRHELEVHGPSYTCAVCCITFLQQSDLQTHLKIHELQHSVAKSNQEALLAGAAVILSHPEASSVNAKPQNPAELARLRASAAEMSFYSNMIPTMNLGFYSETRPEERNEA